MDTVFTPISLGERCEVKFQISRTLYFRKFPGRSEAVFRLTLLGTNYGSHLFGWRLFDWQAVSIASICTYLEQDFQGVFEREDLVIENNEVIHKVLRTNHQHEFEKIMRDGVVLPEMVDEDYPNVRRKFERRAEKFREHLRTPGDFLYICTDIRPEPQVRRMIDLLEAHSPDHRVHLLLVPYEDQNEDLSALGDKVSIAKRPRDPGKTGAMEWEGNDAAWDAALAPFTLDMGFADAFSAATTLKSAPKAGDEDAEAGAPRGLLSRLFKR